jgi:hypothetical protein
MALLPPAAALVAHQGGWDEILFVLVPIALFAFLLALANRRAVREQVQHQAEGTQPEVGGAEGRRLSD